jgi:hypothetical protein
MHPMQACQTAVKRISKRIEPDPPFELAIVAVNNKVSFVICLFVVDVVVVLNRQNVSLAVVYNIMLFFKFNFVSNLVVVFLSYVLCIVLACVFNFCCCCWQGDVGAATTVKEWRDIVTGELYPGFPYSVCVHDGRQMSFEMRTVPPVT